MADTLQIPDSAPFSPDQKAWINGYLAGLSAAGALTIPGYSPNENSVQGKMPEAIPLVILFGSQTGTAESYAHKVAKSAKASGFYPSVVNMADYTRLDLSITKHVLILISTYGDGDMPDSAQSFWEFLLSPEAPQLSGMSFSVLAFGDKNYPQFCQAGKKMDERLEALGAKRVHARVDCDVDYESEADQWVKSVFDILGGQSQLANRIELKNTLENPSPSVKWSKANPYHARLLVNRKLTAEDSGKETRHYELDLTDSGLNYEVGDALGVIPSNNPVIADEIISLLKFSPDEKVSIWGGKEGKLRDILISDTDITKPGRELIEQIAGISGSAELKRLLEPEHDRALKDYLWGRSILNLLESHPVSFATAQDFIMTLRKLQPRLYSISSSQKMHPTQVHLTIASVRYESHGYQHGGVCSTYLADRVNDETLVPVFVHPSPGFKPPKNREAPMIMVGPGTGVAPFRAFLQERKVTGAKGRNWLFFGEQHASSDFFYKDELEQFTRDGYLTRLTTAFSRDQKSKIYVQHRMLEEAKELWSWLEEGACFYVCGDASRMAKDVDAALHEVCEKAGGLTPEGADGYIKDLKAQKRYCRDVY